MSTPEQSLNDLAYEYDRLDTDSRIAWEVVAREKQRAEALSQSAGIAHGKLKDAAFKENMSLPCTIAIIGTNRLITFYEDGYGVSTLLTDAPRSTSQHQES